MKGTAVHPYAWGELDRLRTQIASEAASHRHHHPIRRPAFASAAVLPHVPSGTGRTRSAEAGVRDRVGLALIRVGLRFVDPNHELRQVGTR